jgi:AcrR family transcriptional regulator
VLAATLDVLADHGYDGLCYEDVAARSGVHKTTIYRRWPTKAELVGDAARERSFQLVPVPDTGTLAGDLRALARAVVANIGSTPGGPMVRAVVAAQVTSPAVAADMIQFWRERLDLTTPIVERAIHRGEVPPGTDPALVIETLIGSLYVRLLLTGEPINHRVADQAAALVSAGAAHAGLAG